MALATLSAVLKRSITLLMLLGVFAATAATGEAVAASSPAITDCNSHGALTQHYSVAQLHTALATMPADVQEYTDCVNVIQHQLLAQVSGTHAADVKSPTSGGGSFLPTPVIVILAVLVLGGGALAGVAIQRRSGGSGDS
jgi:hypothetical protein